MLAGKGLASFILGFMAASTALAADLPIVTKAPVAPPPSAFSWTCFYIGGNAGWMGQQQSVGFDDRFAINQLTNVLIPNAIRIPPVAPPNGVILVVIPGTSRDVSGFDGKSDGFTFGGQAGFNWQFDRVVFGVEGDFNGVSSKGSGNVTIVLPATAATTSATVSINRQFETKWMASIRGRLGFTMGARNEVLIYGTGGVAFAGMSITGSDTYTPVPIPGLAEVSLNSPQIFQTSTTPGSAASQTLVGPTFGAGFEWAFWNALSVGLEYRHTQFGSRNAAYTFILPLDPTTKGTAGSVSPPSTLRSRLTTDQVTLRLNWRFSGLGG